MKESTEFNLRMKFIFAMIGITALIRLLPHEMNFTPVGAIALFAGTYILNKRLAFLVPLTALLVSDILLELFYGTGFYRDMIFVYGSFALVVSMGFMLRGREGRQTIMVASLVSSLSFFFITNFGSWLMYDMYPKTLDGLVSSYIAGIPFFRGTVMGDLFYNLVLFGGFALARWRFPALSSNK